jgi:ABC-2 type transport system permease protein
MQGFPLIINFVVQPLFYLSGALFPVHGLPKILDIITKLNPLSYGIDGLRYSLSGVHYFSPVLSFSVLIGVSLLIVAIGVYQFSKIEL